MCTLTGRNLVLAIILNMIAITSSANADELGSFGDRIFQFQEKLALRGNTLAEYKLGTLYEFGVSVEPNEEKASYWYQKAADDDYLPAKNRLIYLEVRHSGFDKAKHAVWLENLVKLAQSSDPNAMILLGQMYRNGIHLKKNLKKALYFLERASSIGHTEIDSQIDSIKRELESSSKQTETSENKRIEETSNPVSKKSGSKKVTAKSTPKPEPKAKPKKQQVVESKEEKRLKYEAAMKKLREEAKMLEQQQKWAESEQ